MRCALRPAPHKGAQGLCTLLLVQEPDTTHHIQSKDLPARDGTCPFPAYSGVLESDRIHKIRGQYTFGSVLDLDIHKTQGHCMLQKV